MPDQNSAYFSRSMALLRKDKGWMKPLLVLAAASLVPIVGLLGVQGYALEWARLTAWGVDSAPKQKDVRVGECIKSGWRGFVAGAGYVLVAGFINGTLSALFGDNVVTSILSIAVSLVGSIAYTVAALRATIYQDYTAGYRFDRMWELFSRDFEGLSKVLLINVAITLVVGIVTSLLGMLIVIPTILKWAFMVEGTSLPTSFDYSDSATMRYLLFGFIDSLASAAPWIAVLVFLASIGGTFNTLITFTATGLWLRNFNVPAWGASEDPLPVMNGLPAVGYGQPAGYGQPVDYGQQPYDQQAYDQQAYAQPQTFDERPWSEQSYDQYHAQQDQPAVVPIPMPLDSLEPAQNGEPANASVTPGYGREVIEVINLTSPVAEEPEQPLTDDVNEPVQSEQAPESIESVQVTPISLDEPEPTPAEPEPEAVTESEPALDADTTPEFEAETQSEPASTDELQVIPEPVDLPVDEPTVDPTVDPEESQEQSE